MSNVNVRFIRKEPTEFVILADIMLEVTTLPRAGDMVQFYANCLGPDYVCSSRAISILWNYGPPSYQDYTGVRFVEIIVE